jgi:hypothetical protein
MAFFPGRMVDSTGISPPFYPKKAETEAKSMEK